MSADRPPFLNPISRHAPFSPLSEAIAAPPVEAQVNRSNLRSYRTKNILSTPSIPEEPGTPKSYYPPVNNPFDSIGSENTDSSDVDAAPANRTNPKVVIERPTPERGRSLASSDTPTSEDVGRPTLTVAATPQRLRPTIASRRHSPISDSGDRLFSALYRVEKPAYRPLSARMSSRANEMKPQIRRVWVKRLGSNTSPTQIIVGEDDLVDDLRDMVLRKYANSLGRTFDAPDVSLKLVHRRVSARHSNHERILSPEENILQVIELFYPGGQTVEEALIVETPQRRTPKHSPRIALPYYMTDHLRPGENAGEYFPPMANTRPHSPSISNHPPPLQSQHRSTAHAIAVLETGQLPDLPSPGSRMTRHSHRPRNPRTHTSSPTVISGGSNLSNHGLCSPALSVPVLTSTETVKSIASQPMHTPPIPNIASEHAKQITPPARVSSPRLSKVGRRTRKPTSENELPTSSPNAQQAALDKSVPPINVLIVEDNIINLRLLEAFLKRLKVRWSTAMNGRDAVTKWRTGGFHLVLMDIQLPIMNGLAATKEIRRLERVNDIGVFTHSPGHTPSPGTEKTLVQSTEGILINADKLKNLSLFKSSVIIVALTASSLQSDRHEALAAGCNDFLTKVLPPFLIQRLLLCFTNTFFSPSVSTGLTAKSWNGAACKPSLTSMAGANGKTFPNSRPSNPLRTVKKVLPPST